jgi:ATP-binding cassette subfamily F protein 3
METGAFEAHSHFFMLQLTGAGKRFGPKLLFENLDWLITAKERAGIVGGNGTGKTTLLKTIAGMESLDYGSLTAMKGLEVGYLPQDGLHVSGRTVFAECLSVFEPLKQMERELGTLTVKMGEVDPAGAEYQQIADRFAQLDHEFRTRDGYALEAQVGTVLGGLGFPKDDWDRLTEEFSGGWQMRIALAKLLLQRPNLLLLDEPTNHLDLEAREWLEQYLTSYENAYILISHDRYFLDVTVRKIVEVWNKQVYFYHGNYEKYLQQKTERRTQLEAAYKNQQDKIQQLEAFISRFRYQATKAKQVQSRNKELDKIERIELPPEEKTIHFTFPQPKPSGRIVAECKGVSKRYGEKLVFQDASFVIERGDRIALVGVNGAGKSTLIKLLSGAEPLTSGEYALGHNVGVDYFAQDQYKVLDSESRMLDDLSEAAPRSTQVELRSLLGCFLFSEDDVFKKIGVLSGGERNRYALARMLLRPSNFLLLDEPTNHLDMRAKDVLLDSLKDFNGTVVFVSHDRYFLENLATRIFEIGDGEVRVFPGNYEDYLWRKQGGAEQLPTLDNVLIGTPAAEPVPISAPHPASRPAKRINPMKLKQMQERARELEIRIAELELAMRQTEDSLANFVSAEESAQLTAQLGEQRSHLDETMAEWEQISEQIEAIA